MVEITLDGKKVEVREGSMVMDAANQLGTYIPHFCYHKKLSIAANCRMCLVDVEKAPKPLPACATPVSSGMIVHTRSEKAIKAQKGVMEFLLINHPLDCPICDQGGECLLQDLAVGYGGSASRYKEEKRVVFHKDVGPLVSMEEMSRCIHCTRCVRFGQEVAGVMELGMLGRGEHAEITTFVGKTVDSELSGNMIDICPVGALTSKPFRYSARTWELSRRKSVSPHDGLGANLIVQVKQGKVLRVVPLENEAVNECWLSDKDRFSYEALNSEQRLTKPMIKQDGKWHEVEWQTALEYVANSLNKVRGEHGAESIGLMATPHSTLEELILLKKLADGIGSPNIDTRLRQSDFSADGSAQGAPWLGMKVADVSALDRALVIGSFLRKDHPLLAQRLRQVGRKGGKINVIHAADDDQLISIANRIITAPSAWIVTLAGIAAAIAEKKGVAVPLVVDDAAKVAGAAIAASLLSGNNKAVFLGNAAVQHPQAAQLLVLAQWIATETGAKLGILTEAANTVGAAMAGVVPGKNGLNAAAMFAQPRKAYVLFNVEPELDAANPAQASAAVAGADTVIVMSAFRHAASDYADVLLPITPFTETSGTFVNAEGRAQSFNGSVKPLGDARPGWKVLRVLSNLLNLPGFEFDSSEAVRDSLTGGQTDLSERCSNVSTVTLQVPVAVEAGLQRVADVPIYFADALVRRSPALAETRDGAAPVVKIGRKLFAELNLKEGDHVRVSQDTAQAVLAVMVDEGLADGCVRVAAGHATTATLGAMFGTIAVEKIMEQA